MSIWTALSLSLTAIQHRITGPSVMCGCVDMYVCVCNYIQKWSFSFTSVFWSLFCVNSLHNFSYKLTTVSVLSAPMMLARREVYLISLAAALNFLVLKALCLDQVVQSPAVPLEIIWLDTGQVMDRQLSIQVIQNCNSWEVAIGFKFYGAFIHTWEITIGL